MTCNKGLCTALGPTAAAYEDRRELLSCCIAAATPLLWCDSNGTNRLTLVNVLQTCSLHGQSQRQRPDIKVRKLRAD